MQQSRAPDRTKRSEAEFIRSIVHGTDGRAQKAATNLPHMTPVRSANRAPHLAVSLRDRADMNFCGNVTANVALSHSNQIYVQSLCSRLGAAIRCGLLDAPTALAGTVASSISINAPTTRAAATIYCSTFSWSPLSRSVLYNCWNPLKKCKKVQRPMPLREWPPCHVGHCRVKRSDIPMTSFENQPALCTPISAMQSVGTAPQPTFVQFLAPLKGRRGSPWPRVGNRESGAVTRRPLTVAWRMGRRRPRLGGFCTLSSPIHNSRSRRRGVPVTMPAKGPVPVTPDTRKLLSHRKSNAGKGVTVSDVFGAFFVFVCATGSNGYDGCAAQFVAGTSASCETIRASKRANANPTRQRATRVRLLRPETPVALLPVALVVGRLSLDLRQCVNECVFSVRAASGC
jgi:hypothetical protein